MMKSHFLKIAFLLVVCLVFGFNADAQGRKMTPEKFDAHIQKLTERLKLDKKQVRKVTKIEKDFFAKMDAIRSEYPAQQPRMKRPAKKSGDDVREKPARTTRDPQMVERNKQRREKIKMLNNQHNNALKTVLTELQFEKYRSAKEDRNMRMRDRLQKAKGQERTKAKTAEQKKASNKKGPAPKGKLQSASDIKLKEG